jgi:plastocyanin
VKRSAGLVAVAILIVCAIVGLPPARGAPSAMTVDVTASGTTFSMPDVTIAPGDTVRWTNGGGTHNVHFDDGSFQMPASPSSSWGGSVERRFDVVGTYTYRCDMHAAFGMTGRVTVAGGSTPTPTPTATPTPPPGGGSGGGGGAPPPELRSVAVTRDHFCTRRGRTCKKPGVVLSIDLSAPAAVTGALSRAPLHGAARYKRFGSVDFGQVAAGKRELRFNRTTAGKRVTPARYKLVLKAAGTTRTLRFRVRPS